MKTFATFEEQLNHFNRKPPQVPHANVEFGQHLAETYGLDISWNYLVIAKNYRIRQERSAPDKQRKDVRLPEVSLRQGGKDALMALLATGDPLTVRDVANRLGKSPSGIGQVLKRLCDRGLATMTRKWKSKFFSLTKEGEKLADEVKP